jgi:hypothetical protein
VCPEGDHDVPSIAAAGDEGAARGPQHRALRRLASPAARVWTSLLLAGAFDAATWSLRSSIATGWTEVSAFWVRKLELVGAVTVPRGSGRWLEAALPAIEVAAREPDRAIWWSVLTATAALLLGTRLLPESLLPLRYLARLVCFLQGTALLFFLLAPDAFPLTLAEYTRSAGQSALWLMLIVPWIHALTYGVFAFSLSRRLALTALTLGFLGVAAPLLLMAHVYLIAKLSLLVLPVLYFVFGMPMLILACIGLYGWAMSWERTETAPQPLTTPPAGR